MSGQLVVPGIDDEDIGTLLNVRTYEYYLDMVKQIQAGQCPFCQLDRSKNVVLYENDSWMVWLNPFPNKNTTRHIILAHKLAPPFGEHLTHISEMSADDWQGYGEANTWAVRNWDLPGGALVTRFGHPALNAGSVRHLHSNILVPDGKGELRIPLAKDPADIAQKLRVLMVFEKMRQGAALDDLSEHEFELVKDRLK